MKIFLTTCLILLCFHNFNIAKASFAEGDSSLPRKYYLSASGNDSNPGTTPEMPWKTINRLNLAIFTPGDSVFFHSGEIFTGSVNVIQPGTLSNRIVFTSYGTGDKPIISGAENITGWTIYSGGIYQANCLPQVTAFYFDGKEEIIARYPNEHQYLTLDTASAGWLQDSTLSTISASLLTSAKICIHTAQWCWEKTAVSSFTTNRINYTNPTEVEAIKMYGYFLYDNLSHLDTVREWKYDPGTHKLFYYPIPGQDPNLHTCQISVNGAGYRNGFQFGSSCSFVTVSGLAFEKQANAGVSVPYATNQNILIENCSFTGQYNYGVNDKGQYNEIRYCSFRDVDGIGVMVNNTGFHCTIHHNTFRNIGQYRNSGIGSQINLSAIQCAFVDSCHIHHNNIDSVGYCGISVDGACHIVERNLISHVMLLNNDGGALKSYGAPSHHIIFRNNIISYGDGNTEGAYHATFVTPAIYFDYNVNNCLITQNTISHHQEKGIFQNSGNNHNTITYNVFLGGSCFVDLNGTNQQPDPITGMDIRHNSFFGLTPDDFMIRQFAYSLSEAKNQGTIDSNYYFQPYDPYNCAMQVISDSVNYFDFAEWKETTGFDTHTRWSFVNWTAPTTHAVLFTNPTDQDSVLNLGENQYLDLDSNIVCGTVTLSPYTSVILIETLNPCTPPVPVNLFIRDVTWEPGESGCYNATQNLVTAGGGTIFWVENGANIELIAGQKINMLSGTRVFPGAYLKGHITSTGDYCEIPAIPVNGTEPDLAKIPEPATHFRIFPNPVTDILNIMDTGSENYAGKTIVIYTILGEKVAMISLPGEKNLTVRMNELSPGLYFLEINCKGEKQVLKIIKRR